MGLAPGLTLADARARVPGIAVLEHDPEADRRMLRLLADACDRYTPLVGFDKGNGLMLDIAGSAHLFGGEGALLGDVLARCEKAGFTTVAAIASSPDTARAVARCGPGGLVAEGLEAEAVSGLPVLALDLGQETEVALLRAGLKTVGDLAARPRGPLVARFGAAIGYRLDRLLGRERASISPRRAVADIIVEKQFAEPIGYETDIDACLFHLAGEAAKLLEKRTEGGRGFEASFFRADGEVRRIAIATARPLSDPAALMRLFRAKLEGLADPLDPGFGFDLIRLAVTISEGVAPAQADFTHAHEEMGGAVELVERLSARFGTGNVGRFSGEDTHRPERASRLLPALGESPDGKAWPQPEEGEPPARPLFLFEPPQRIEATAEVPDGPPRQFTWRRVAHLIVLAEGPERIASEWWREEEKPFTRDYYRLEDAAGRRFWVYREGLFGEEAISPRWFLHGVFP